MRERESYTELQQFLISTNTLFVSEASISSFCCTEQCSNNKRAAEGTRFCILWPCNYLLAAKFTDVFDSVKKKKKSPLLRSDDQKQNQSFIFLKLNKPKLAFLNSFLKLYHI